MIKLENIHKTFGKYPAIKDVSLNIEDSQVFGLVGTNGAGKSTLLRMISGVLRQDSGEITLDGRPVYNRPDVKQQIFFIPDDPYFFPNGNAADMCSYYRTAYLYFNPVLFEKMLGDFSLDPKRPIRNYSRGMKKQLAILCGICSGARYLLCDETFDGLDPVMRQAVKSIFADHMSRRGLTPVIASHNLRELEDMRLGLQRIQCVFAKDDGEAQALAGLEVLNSSTRGRLHMLTVRASREEVLSCFEKIDTVFFEILPLTLEEIFISETEVAGYDIKNIILG